MKPNFYILISHFGEWVKVTKDPNFEIQQYDRTKVVSSLESGYAFVRTRFLDKNKVCASSDDVKLRIIHYTYLYAFIDVNGLVNVSDPSATTTSIEQVEIEVEKQMIADGFANY